MLTAPDAWLSMVNQRRTELLAEADRQRLAAAVARPDCGWLRRLAALRHGASGAPVARHDASAAPAARHDASAAPAARHDASAAPAARHDASAAPAARREVRACPPPATRPA
jgi:hypothetical protein